MRRLIAALLTAAVLLPTAVSSPAVSHGQPGTKKWCRHHEKKCRKAYRKLESLGPQHLSYQPRFVVETTDADGTVVAEDSVTPTQGQADEF